MVRFFLFSFLTLIYSTLFAQMPNGSTGPDFTSTDINGNTIQLYADFLDQGIPVIMDVSATWCSPCWGFHESHAMKDLYMTYGAAGSNGSAGSSGSGGSSGGAAGYYIYNRGSITFNNSGTVAGQ